MNEFWKRRLRKINPLTWAYIEKPNLPTVLLVGSARSGTTWIEEVIHSTSSYRMMFEPFHPDKVDEFRNFLPYQYIRPTDRRPGFVEPVSKGVHGNIRSFWVDQFNGRLLFKKRLIKDVRSLLYLEWLHKMYPAIPMIYLIRHPFSVAMSRTRLGFPAELNCFLQQDQLMEDFLQPYSDLLHSKWTQFESHVISWCVENMIPLSRIPVGEYCPVFYEHVVQDPSTQFQRIFTALGTSCTPAQSIIEKPSRLSSPSTNKSTNDRVNRKWFDYITASEIDNGLSIIETFGMQQLYNLNSEPVLTAEFISNLNYECTLITSPKNNISHIQPARNTGTEEIKKGHSGYSTAKLHFLSIMLSIFGVAWANFIAQTTQFGLAFSELISMDVSVAFSSVI